MNVVQEEMPYADPAKWYVRGPNMFYQSPYDPDITYMSVGQKEVGCIDTDMVDKVSQYRWRSMNKYYAYRNYKVNGKRKREYLHNFLTDCPDDKEVDHINLNGFDNRLANLRVCTHQQNSFNVPPRKKNRSGYRGVHFHPQSGMWRAIIGHNGIRIDLSLYRTKEDAAKAWNAKAKELYGEHAWLNPV